MTDLRNLTTRPAPTLERGEDWRDSAACLGHEALFDHVIDCPSDADAEDEALALCVTCPVMEMCRDKLGYLEHGIVGGLTAKQRRAIARGSSKPMCQECGRTFAHGGLLAIHASSHAETCKRGHVIAEVGRYSDRTCRECRRQATRARRARLAEEAS
jgi:hypothetical protein